MKSHLMKSRWRALFCPTLSYVAFVWNCRGLGHPSTVKILRNYTISHRPDVMFLSKVNCNCNVKVENIMKSLGFMNVEFVPTVGSSRGLLLSWKDHVKIKILLENNNINNCLVLNKPSKTPWKLTISMDHPFRQSGLLSGRAFWK